MSLELPCTSCVEHGRSPSLCIKLSKGELETQIELTPTNDSLNLNLLLEQLDWERPTYVPKTPIPTLPWGPDDLNIDESFIGNLAYPLWDDPSADDALRLATIALRVRSVEGNEYREAALCFATEAFDNIFWAERESVGCSHIVAANLLAWIAYTGVGLEEYRTTQYFGLSYNFICDFLHSERDADAMVDDTDVVLMHAPFVLDCVNAWITRNGGIPPRMTKFSQRVTYFD